MRTVAGALPPPVIDVGSFQGRDIIVQFGLAGLPASFQNSIRRLLGYYLGSRARPVPFGGRTAQLARLNAWLAAQRKRFGPHMILGVGGPRESEAPGIYVRARALLAEVLHRPS